MRTLANELSLILDGVELNNPAGRYGYLEVDGIDGWWKAPSRKTRDEARPNADGDYDSIDHYEARYVDIKGAFVAKNDGSRWAGADQLTALLSRGPALLIIRIDGQAQWARVKLVDFEGEWTAPRLYEYGLKVKAVDPRKYGGTEIFSVSAGASAVSVFHRGTYPASAVVSISGSMPGGYRLTKGGKVVSVDAALGAAVHELDLRTGILRIGGSVVEGGVNRFEWDTIAPGLGQGITLTPQTTGTGTAGIEVTDTYI